MKIDHLDALETFLNLKKVHAGAFFFESEDLSVIGLDSFETMRLLGREMKSADFMQGLKAKTKILFAGESSFPFEQGGAFGCLGYEVAGLIEPKLMEYGYFAKLADSDEVVAEIFFSKNLIVFEHHKNVIHLALSSLKVEMSDFRQKKINTIQKVEVGFEGLKSTMGEQKFFENIKELKSHIQAGNIFQAVLSERFEFQTSESALSVYSRVKSASPSAYSFYFDFKDSSFFGASPETLVKSVKNEIETHPIAGTRPRGSDEKADDLLERQLKRSVKEGAEHLMLVDLARNDLGRVAQAGSVKVDIFRKILRLSHVMHLVSVVKAKKKSDKTNLDVLGACFPAGTLSGAPKVRAMQILSTLESRPRGFYGGAVIALDQEGDFDSCIAIRSVEMKNQTVILRAGAGIVADSRPEKEYQEIQHKLKALLSVIKAGQLVEV